MGEYVGRSKKSLSRQRRVRTSALAVIALLFVISVVVSVLAVISREQAVQAHQPESILVAQEATNALTTGNVPLGTLLAIEARQRADTPQAASAVATAAAEPLVHAASRGSDVTTVAFSPDDKTLASGDSNGRVVVYDLASYRTIATFDDGSPVYSVAFSPNGEVVASGDSAGRVLVYDVVNGETIATLNYGNPVYSVAFSPDGKALASGDADGQVVVYGLASHKTITTVDDGSTVYSVAFNPDGRNLASGDGDGQVWVYDLAGQEAVAAAQRREYGLQRRFQPRREDLGQRGRRRPSGCLRHREPYDLRQAQRPERG